MTRISHPRFAAAVALVAAAAASRLVAQQPTHEMHGMGTDSAMAMPIPMPAGMKMMPGLVGLTPKVTPFLPGAGRDPMRLPPAKPATITPLRHGDTLDLTAALVRRTIHGRAFAMYGFNGQVPGPLIRVPRGACRDTLSDVLGVLERRPC